MGVNTIEKDEYGSETSGFTGLESPSMLFKVKEKVELGNQGRWTVNLGREVGLLAIYTAEMSRARRRAGACVESAP